MKECPKCELVSPDSAERCECGYPFPSGSIQPPKLAVRRAARTAIKGVAGVAVVFWLLAPVTRYPGLAVFLASAAVLLACLVGIRLLDQ